MLPQYHELIMMEIANDAEVTLPYSTNISIVIMNIHNTIITQNAED
jgi:hypothetical protein